MNKLICLTLVSCGIFVLSGCCDIPSNTPLLIEKTSERIQTRSTVVSKTLRTVLDEADFTRADVEEAISSLESIDNSQLTQKDQKILASVFKTLKQAKQALKFNEKYASVPGETERIFGEVVNTLKLLQEVVGAEIDKKALVQNMIDLIEKSKGEK